MQELKKAGTFIEQNLFFIILFGLMLSGILVGALVFCGLNGDTADRLSFLGQGFLEERYEKSSFAILADSFFSATAYLIVIFLLGFSAISQPFEFLVPFFKGLGLGATVAQIYSLTGTKGFIIVLFLILPGAAIVSLGMLIAVKDAVRFSNLLLHTAVSTGYTNGMRENTRLFCSRILIFEAVMAAGALTDCICSLLFAKILLN
ncbi:MAG: hypothetical protein WC900_04395 [Oscillospiraceae bacterium]|jgi:stage II sporulation protein M